MSGTLSTSLRHFLDSQRSSRKSGPLKNRFYTEILEDFWQKKYVDVASSVSAKLAEDPDSDHIFPYYRLWIESLAECRDHDSLRALKKHLFRRGQESAADHSTFFALRGLVHLELDEIGAAQLASKGLEGIDQNAYALELVQRVTMRLAPAGVSPGENADQILCLLHSKTKIKDYFHWNYLVQGLISLQAEEPLSMVLEHLGHVFPRSPLPHLVEYHRCIERSYFAAAATVAERLREMAPEHVDYMYYLAYALFEDGDYPSARKILHDANRATKGHDAEVVGLLGHCHAKLGGAKEAAECLQQSMQLLEKDGMPCSHVAMEYLEVQAELESQAKLDTQVMPRDPQGWLFDLSPRRYYELMTSPENLTEHLLRPLGVRALPGDLCFLTTSSERKPEWSIVAVYAVESEPIWHPVQGHHSILKCITKFPQGIPLNIAPMPAPLEGSLVEHEANPSMRDSWDDVTQLAKRFGISVPVQKHAFPRGRGMTNPAYQLDAEALITIEKVISEHKEDIFERRKSNQTRRPTA